MKRLLQSIWRGWKAFAHFLGRIQTTVVLTLLYLVLLPVFSLVRLRDPLRRRLGEGDSYWEPMEEVDASVEEAGRRF